MERLWILAAQEIHRGVGASTRPFPLTQRASSRTRGSGRRGYRPGGESLGSLAKGISEGVDEATHEL